MSKPTVRKIKLAAVLLAIFIGLGLSYFNAQGSANSTPQRTKVSATTAKLAQTQGMHALTAGPPHGDAPVLECWDCHGEHPDRSQAPPASQMSCFDCHEIKS